jgi:hypothetical protein
MHTNDCCKWGHPWTPESTYINTRGHRVCKICRRVAVKRPHPGGPIAPRIAEAIKAYTETSERGCRRPSRNEVAA